MIRQIPAALLPGSPGFVLTEKNERRKLSLSLASPLSPAPQPPLPSTLHPKREGGGGGKKDKAVEEEKTNDRRNLQKM